MIKYKEGRKQKKKGGRGHIQNAEGGERTSFAKE